MAQKFGCCDVCTHREDALVCEDCDKAREFEIDQTLIEIGEDGFAHIRTGARQEIL